ncbi:saccharopine dehydrogenase NADP-binding domain-containing protein [Streptomyces sp. NPDC048172]|uniref:saccharopine dehydrogenase NADP-binding domain-containing protein n=1 Tax=Streptomyces sp. NPDC048172 TaxID=3365505 RepID=UPI003714E2AB
MTAPAIAIYGAYGHTGRLVADELLARGRDMILAGRDPDALASLAAELEAREARGGASVRTHTAAVDDPGALRRLADSAAVLVHCAGPFSRTGAPVAAAAAEAGCHYVDHALEPHHVKHVFDTLQATAERTGTLLVPGVSFYGGLGDLLASAVADGLPEVDRIVLAYGVLGWRLTTGAKNTAAQLFAETERLTYADGALSVGYVEPRNAVFAFPPPLGPRSTLTPFPSFEPLTVPRHVPTRNVDMMLTSSTFEEPEVFESEDLDDGNRAASDFMIAAQAIYEGGNRAGDLRGHDLWRVAAVASVEAAVRIADGAGPVKTGVLAPAEAFPAREFLRALEAQGLFDAHLPEPSDQSDQSDPSDPSEGS